MCAAEALVAIAQLPRARGSKAGADVAPSLSPSTLSLSPLLRALLDHYLLLLYPQGGPGPAASSLEG